MSKLWASEKPLLEDNSMGGVGILGRRGGVGQQGAGQLAELRLRRHVHEAKIRLHQASAATDAGVGEHAQRGTLDRGGAEIAW